MNIMQFRCIFLVFILLIHEKVFGSLLDDLLSKYDPRQRPAKNNQTVPVTFSMQLRQLVEMDEKAQSIKISAWVDEIWFDDYLVWNPEDYDGQNQITAPHDLVWKPDTYLYQNLQMSPTASERKMLAKMTTYPIINRTLVHTQYPAIYHATCAVDVSTFPFDTQVCNFTFGSWTYAAEKILYFADNNMTGSLVYVPHQEWVLLNFTSKADLACLYDGLCYSQVNFVLTIRRKPLYFIINLIIPSLLVTEFCTLGMFTKSSTGPERSQKIPQGLTAIMSLSVFLMMVSNQMPRSSKAIPLMDFCKGDCYADYLGWYFVILILLLAMQLVATTVIIYLDWMGKNVQNDSTKEKQNKTNQNKENQVNRTNSMEKSGNESEIYSIKNKEESLIKGVYLLETIRRDLMKLRESLKMQSEKLKESNKKCPNKYSKAADCLEMFCLVFFLIANAVPAIIMVLVGGT